MSMARDMADQSPWPNSVRASADGSGTHGMAVHRGPSRRNSRRALTERALAEGAARTRSKVVRARESRMSITSNGGTTSPSGFSVGMSLNSLLWHCHHQASNLNMFFIIIEHI